MFFSGMDLITKKGTKSEVWLYFEIKQDTTSGVAKGRMDGHVPVQLILPVCLMCPAIAMKRIDLL